MTAHVIAKIIEAKVARFNSRERKVTETPKITSTADQYLLDYIPKVKNIDR
jgi:hypothetical protein